MTKHGVTVYNYSKDKKAEHRPAQIVLITGQSSNDMAAVMIEELGIDEAAKVAAAILQQVQAKRMKRER